MTGKSQRISDIVKYLRDKFGAGNILINNHREHDQHAIGLTDKTGQYLAYISTISDKDDDYYVALENPPLDNNLPYSPAGDFDNVRLTELENLLKKHFQLNK